MRKLLSPPSERREKETFIFVVSRVFIDSKRGFYLHLFPPTRESRLENFIFSIRSSTCCQLRGKVFCGWKMAKNLWTDASTVRCTEWWMSAKCCCAYVRREHLFLWCNEFFVSLLVVILTLRSDVECLLCIRTTTGNDGFLYKGWKKWLKVSR